MWWPWILVAALLAAGVAGTEPGGSPSEELEALLNSEGFMRINRHTDPSMFGGAMAELVPQPPVIVEEEEQAVTTAAPSPDAVPPSSVSLYELAYQRGGMSNMEKNIAAVFSRVAYGSTPKPDQTPTIEIPASTGTVTEPEEEEVVTTTTTTTTTESVTTSLPTPTDFPYVHNKPVSEVPKPVEEAKTDRSVPDTGKVEFIPMNSSISSSQFNSDTSSETPSTVVPEVIQKPATTKEPHSEPGPDWIRSRQLWGVLWELYLYSCGTLFVLVALYAFVNIIRVKATTYLFTRGYYLTINVSILILGVCRSVFFFYDPYNIQDTYSPVAALLIFETCFPCLTASFAALFLGLLQVTQVNLLHSSVQRPQVLAIILAIHFTLNIAIDCIVGTIPYVTYLLLVCQSFFIVWCTTLSCAYFYIFSTLYRAGMRKQGEIIRSTFTKMHIEGSALPKKLPKPTFGLSVKMALCVAVMGIMMIGVQLFGMLGVYAVANGARPHAWSWFVYQLLGRSLEILMCFIMVFLSAQPLGKKTVEMDPEKCSVFTLFKCPAQSSPPPGKGTDEMYPTICSTNHVVHDYPLQTGKPIYDDSFPLRNVYTKIAPGHGLVPVTALPSRCSTLTDSRTPTNQSDYVPTYSTVGNLGRPSSMLFNDAGFVRFRSAHDPEQPMDEVLRVSSIKRAAMEGNKKKMKKLECVDVDGNKHYLSDSYYDDLKKKHASTCSSVSAANSFDVQFFPSRSGDDQGRRRAYRSLQDRSRQKHCGGDLAQLHVKSPSPVYTDASPSHIPINFLTDLDTSTSQINVNCSTEAVNRMSDSDVFSTDGEEEGSADDELSDKPELELSRGGITMASGQDDVTPDSAVVADIGDSDASRGGSGFRQRINSSSRGIFSKLRGSNFSLGGQHYGYSPLDGDESLRKASSEVDLNKSGQTCSDGECCCSSPGGIRSRSPPGTYVGVFTVGALTDDVSDEVLRRKINELYSGRRAVREGGQEESSL